MGLFKDQGVVYKPVEEVDLGPKSDHVYLRANVKAPRMAGLLVKIFTWFLESRIFGTILVYMLKKNNLIHKLVTNAQLEESPLYVPLHPFKDLKEQEVKCIDSKLSPPEQVQQAMDCLPDFSEKSLHGLQSSFRHWTILDYSRAYNLKEITPRMVAERFIAAVHESSNPPSRMSFFIDYNAEDILRQADKSTLRYEQGNPISILDGIPIAIKDEIDCSPYPTTGGTKWLHKVRPCTGDASCVKCLRLCGAILVGKTNMHEIGAGTSGINPHYGATRNPYDISKIAGGSSSGSAAVVAAGLCPVALGVDGGGSVRMPAALCGVIGLKPTFGRIPHNGVLPFNWTVGMVGILAGTIEDAFIVYAAMNGQLPPDQPTRPKLYFPLLNPTKSISDVKMAKYAEWFNDCSDDIRTCCSQALDKLQEHYSWKIVEVTIPEIEVMRLAHYSTIGSECTASLSSHLEKLKPEEIGWDARVALSVYGSFSSKEYIKAQKIRNRQMQFHMKIFAEADVIVSPTTGVTAYPIQDDASETGELDYINGAALVRYSIAGNFLGLPAVTVPVGYDKLGLPIGLQFIGQPWSEPTLIHIASAMQATRDEGETIAEILQIYERASGQSINLEKSSVYFSRNTSDSQKGQILGVLGVKEVSRFETYLGLPTLIGRAKYHTFSYLKDRIWKKLQGWKGTLLSRAGKEILIKAVAQSIPTYTMSVFQIPLKLCDELDALCAKFWWGQVNNERKIHWKSWDKLTIAKKEGGMGFRDLRAFNLAMLAKQGWRMIKDNDSLLYKCFKARYFPRSNFLEAKESPNCSYVWRSLMAAMPILQYGHCWRVGNGFSINALKDKWIPNFPTNKVLNPIQDNGDDLMVCELINPELNTWRYEDIRTIFHSQEADAICQIPLSRRFVADTIIWIHNSRGLFTVKSAYHVARRILTDAARVGTSGGGVAKKVWSTIWKLQIPNKIKVFAWRACHEILPTAVNLTRRRIIHEDFCVLCTREPESTIHTLWDCAVAQDVWAGSARKLQKHKHGQTDLVQLMEDLLERVNLEELGLFWTQAWLIWNQRNSVLHGGKLKSPGCLNKRAEECMEDYQRAQIRLNTQPRRQPYEEVWKPPHAEAYKLNFDAATFTDLGRTGMGAIIRNEKGEVMAAMAACGPAVQTSDEAELLACRRALEFAVDAGFSRLIIEGDNSNVIRDISSSGENTSPFGNVVDDIRHLIRGLAWSEVCCIRRGGNRVAHVLAHHARQTLDEDLYWLEDSPPPALDALYHDLLSF